MATQPLGTELVVSTDTVSAQRQSVEALMTGIESMQLQAKALVVSNDAEYQTAMELRNQANAKAKTIDGRWKPLKTLINGWRNSIIASEKQTTGAWEAVVDLIDDKCRNFLLKKKQAAEQANRELARMAEQEKRKLAKEAEALMARGYAEEAIVLQQQANMTMTPVVVTATPRAEGIAVIPKFKGRCVDIIAVCKAIVDGKVPLMHECRGEERPLVNVDQVVLNALVSRQQDGLKIPGILVEEDVDFRGTGR